MITDRDVARILEVWLDEDTAVMPDRVLDAVLDEVPETAQRHAQWQAPRSQTMNNPLRIALVAAVVVAAAVGVYAFAQNNIGPPAPSPSPTDGGESGLGGSILAWTYEESTSGGGWLAIQPDGTQSDITPSFAAADAPPGTWLLRRSPDGSEILAPQLWDQGEVFALITSANGEIFRELHKPEGAPSYFLCSAWTADGARLLCGGVDAEDSTKNGLYTVRASDGGDLRSFASVDNDTGLYMVGDYLSDPESIIGMLVQPNEYEGILGVVQAGNEGEFSSTSRLMTARYIYNGEFEDDVPSPPSYSPARNQIVAASQGRLFLVDHNGGTQGALPVEIPIPNDPEKGTPTAGFPEWSPDGSWIVFSMAYPDRDIDWDLYLIRPDGTGLTQLTDTLGIWEVNPDWTD